MLWLHWRRPRTGKHYCQALHKDDWTQVAISTQVTSNLGNKDTIRAKIPTPSQATTRQTNGWETDFKRNVKDEGPEMPTHPQKLGGNNAGRHMRGQTRRQRPREAATNVGKEGRQQETNPNTATNSKANSASLASGMCSKTCQVEGGKVLGGKTHKTVSERHFNFCCCCFWYPILLQIWLWNAGVLSQDLKAYIPLDRSYPWHPNNGWWVGLGIRWSHHAAAIPQNLENWRHSVGIRSMHTCPCIHMKSFPPNTGPCQLPTLNHQSWQQSMTRPRHPQSLCPASKHKIQSKRLTKKEGAKKWGKEIWAKEKRQPLFLPKVLKCCAMKSECLMDGRI